MPVETRETQPLACFDKPAHPDKGGTVPITSSQTVNPRQIDTFHLAVFAMTVCPRPEPEELADHGVLLQSAERRQPDHGWIVC
jgi:mannose/cellobiose epimerase-like protein (N-acyl-D-glucosamine 2-epimerase family)